MKADSILIMFISQIQTQIRGPWFTSRAVSGFDVNLLKLFMNLKARSVAAICHFILDSHTLPGSSISGLIPSMLSGMFRLNTGNVENPDLFIDPSRMTFIIFLVMLISILSPVPYGPPIQPVLTNQA